jgi:hypothetical protein
MRISDNIGPARSPALVAVPGTKRLLPAKQFGETIMNDDDAPAWAGAGR